MEPDTNIPLPLPAQVLKFIDAYCAHRDIKKAGLEAGLPTEADAKRLYRRHDVHDEITRRMGSITAQADTILAKKRVVNVEALDRNLMQVVSIPRKTLEATPSLATPKVNAIEMGYKRVGLLLDGNFVPDASSGPAAEEAPRIYRPAEQTIITHQIETRQVVTSRTQQYSPQVPQDPMHNPPTIDAEIVEDPWANF